MRTLKGKIARFFAGAMLAIAVFAALPAHAFATGDLVVATSAELRPFARFNVQNVLIQENAGMVRVNYALPIELTGNPIQVEFQGKRTGDVVALVGHNGTMSCHAIACEIRFKDLAVNPAAVRAQLSALGLSEEEIAARLRVQEAFSADPKGSIQFH